MIGEPSGERPEENSMTDSATAAELRQIIEQFEQLESERNDLAERQKELMADAKGRGYDTAAFMAIIALRKKDADDVAEFESILEIYKAAMGM